ncbi:hypothetical protein SAMD00019534_020000 [Acytostelium subglobosum LB1]|uniref:hypothetical protein n=1 Tax=Acytostelium subglobosum LB1 TaxID=1410327 RepID=UPI000644D0D2|nr:hypothetical protein SAMD00019534_020000 [Acytostelium subglobosum LB1]GAM18825.1 hypothetical protein SAMD00019534_020000 [Acytostelium subglobosum LB1]|eukprot:XP_012758045.1 hypothetical protein SAMD00019534_020000 [Acytostelium subglobosum LB1]
MDTEYKSGYLYRLGGIGIFKYRKKLWFTLTSTHLSCYVSSEKKSTPVESITLNSIKKITLLQKDAESIQTTYGFCIEYVSGGSGSGQSAGSLPNKLVIQANPISTLADWVIKLDGLTHRDFNSYLDQAERKLLLKILFKNNIQGGIIKSNGDEEWSYSPIGTLSTIEGTYSGAQIDYHWDGEWLRSSTNELGAGRFNGVYLAWYLAGVDPKAPHATTATPDIVYFWDEREKEYQTDQGKELTFKWTRHFLASKFGRGEWIVEGHVPQAVVMFLQLIKYRRTVDEESDCVNPFAGKLANALASVGGEAAVLPLASVIKNKEETAVESAAHGLELANVATIFTKGQATLDDCHATVDVFPMDAVIRTPSEIEKEFADLISSCTSSHISDEEAASLSKDDESPDERYIATSSSSNTTTPESSESPPSTICRTDTLRLLNDTILQSRQLQSRMSIMNMEYFSRHTPVATLVTVASLAKDKEADNAATKPTSPREPVAPSQTQTQTQTHTPKRHPTIRDSFAMFCDALSTPEPQPLQKNILEEILSPQPIFPSTPLGSVIGPSNPEHQPSSSSNNNNNADTIAAAELIATQLRQSFCLACNLPISGQKVLALGNSFHKDCFKCHKCHRELCTKTFYRQGLINDESPEDSNTSTRSSRSASIFDLHSSSESRSSSTPQTLPQQQHSGTPKYLCENCFNDTCPVCPKCNANVMFRCVSALGKKWHTDHFCCVKCSANLVGMPFFDHEGQLLCQVDYDRIIGNINSSSSNISTTSTTSTSTTSTSTTSTTNTNITNDININNILHLLEEASGFQAY